MSIYGTNLSHARKAAQGCAEVFDRTYVVYSDHMGELRIAQLGSFSLPSREHWVEIVYPEQERKE